MVGEADISAVCVASADGPPVVLLRASSWSWSVHVSTSHEGRGATVPLRTGTRQWGQPQALRCGWALAGLYAGCRCAARLPSWLPFPQSDPEITN